MQNYNIPFRTMIDLVEAANRIDGYADSLTEAYAPLDTKGIVGAFTEATRKNRFEYRNSTDPWGKSHGLPHEVCVSRDGDRKEQWRVANVKGTVCYIAVDEGADGKPVMEKWAIRNHVKYVKAESVESVGAANRIDEQGSDPFNWRKGDTLPIHQRNPKRFEVFAGLFDYSGFGMGNYHSKGGRRIWTDRANAERLAKSDGVELVVHDRFGENWDGIVREAVEYKINDPRLVKAAHAALSPKHSSDPAKVTKMAQVMWNMWAQGDGTVKVAELARLARVKLGYE